MGETYDKEDDAFFAFMRFSLVVLGEFLANVCSISPNVYCLLLSWRAKHQFYVSHDDFSNI